MSWCSISASRGTEPCWAGNCVLSLLLIWRKQARRRAKSLSGHGEKREGVTRTHTTQQPAGSLPARMHVEIARRIVAVYKTMLFPSFQIESHTVEWFLKHKPLNMKNGSVWSVLWRGGWCMTHKKMCSPEWGLCHIQITFSSPAFLIPFT